MYAQDNNPLPVWIILTQGHHHISTNSQPFLVGIVSNLSFPHLEKPRGPGKDPTFAQQQEYKSEYDNWNKAKQRRTHNMQQVFALILGQCSDTIKNRIRSDQQWSDINQENDVTKLLSLIQDGLYQNAANLDKTHAMIEADERLNKFRQGDKMSIYEYREKMKSPIDIYAAMGGEPGMTEIRVVDFMKRIPTDSREIAKEVARDHYLGMMLICRILGLTTFNSLLQCVNRLVWEVCSVN